MRRVVRTNPIALLPVAPMPKEVLCTVEMANLDAKTDQVECKRDQIEGKLDQSKRKTDQIECKCEAAPGEPNSETLV